MKLITSWDDGSPHDARLAEMLAAYGLKGTFFVPINNMEGRPVMGADTIRELDSHFEVASHTRDHQYLTTIEQGAASRQVRDGKVMLEDMLGHAIPGFAYPGGKYTPAVISLLPELGIEYARTVENLCYSRGTDQYRIPTTLQFYPHRPIVYAKNFLRYGGSMEKIPALYQAFSSASLNRRLIAMARYCSDHNAFFHLWGHSWEIDEFNLWGDLANFFDYLTRSQEIEPLTIYEAFKAGNS